MQNFTQQTTVHYYTYFMCIVSTDRFFVGTNIYATQKGMNLGAQRHVSDIKVSELSREAQALLHAQTGTNDHASQKGMSIGSQRHVTNIKADETLRETESLVPHQSGEFTHPSRLHCSVFFSFDLSFSFLYAISCKYWFALLFAGDYNKASQKGMSIGDVRHVPSAVAVKVSAETEGIVPQQSGMSEVVFSCR